MRLFTLLLLLLSGSLLTAQTNHDVEVTSNVFTPSTLTIEVGDMVTWTNVQGVHNVNGELDAYPDNPEGFGNGNAAPPGWEYTHTFTIPGTYEYRCDPHFGLGMVGTIVVEAAGGDDAVVITEFMYNPPEGGTDSLEFIEIYNPGMAAIDMENWTMSDGVTFTFPAYTLAAESYLILAVNESAFRNNYNYTGDVLQWEGGALSNGGEAVTISNAAGTVIDEFVYDDVAPWPLGTDGEGASVVLCDFAADNSLGTNWQAATTGTGTTINGAEIFANPGAVSECGDAVQLVFWINNDLVVNEDAGTVSAQFVAQNFVADETIEFNFAAIAGEPFISNSDVINSGDFPLTFTTTDQVLDTFTVNIEILDDDIEEPDESMYMIAPILSPLADTIRFTIRDNDSPVNVTAIDDINDLNADGTAISEGQTVTLQGVVHCLDFREGDGYQFWIIEPATEDGINVFGFNDVSDYQATEGDELQITGEIDQFRGLLEIIPTNIVVVSSGNQLVAPTDVGALEESVESKLVRLSLAGPVETDPIVRAGGGWNVSVIEFSSQDTTTLRVEDEIGVDSLFLANYFAGGTGYLVTGLASQRDFDAPFDDFYQLYPCGPESFDYLSSVNEPAWASEVSIFPNPTSGLLTVNLPLTIEGYRLIDIHGRVVLQQQVVNTQQLQLDMSNLPNGMYQLQMMNGAEFVSRPVLKQ